MCKFKLTLDYLAESKLVIRRYGKQPGSLGKPFEITRASFLGAHAFPEVQGANVFKFLLLYKNSDY